MSVILTAARRKNDKKKTKKKNSEDSFPKLVSFTPLPEEMCMKKNTIWRWVHDGHPYALAFCKENMIVWCNGLILETVNSFTDDGAVIDFCISGMAGRILSRGADERIEHCLEVDGNYIPDELAMQNMAESSSENVSHSLHDT